MDQTPNLNLPIPNENAVPPTNISAEFPRIALALTMLDTIIHDLQGVVADKADANHNQAMSTITGLVEALAEKMPANATFSLDSLTDVQGAAEAAVNYVLVKNAEGNWVPSSALAAIGEHEHSIAQVVGLGDLLTALSQALDDLSTSKADATGVANALANRVRFDAAQELTSGQQAQARANIGAVDAAALPAYNRWGTISYVTLSGSGLWSLAGLSEFHHLRLTADFRSAGGNAIGDLHFSNDNGATYLASAGTYNVQRDGSNIGGVYGAGGDVSGIPAFGGGNALTAGETAGIETTILIHRFNKALRSIGTVKSSGIHSQRFTDDLSFLCASPTAHNAIRILFSSAVNGTIHLEGIKG